MAIKLVLLKETTLLTALFKVKSKVRQHKQKVFSNADQLLICESVSVSVSQYESPRVKACQYESI